MPSFRSTISLPLFACALACANPEPSVTEATYAGRADDEQTFVVALRNGTSLLIYACDDARDAWFRAAVLASPMELTNEAGDTLFLALGDEAAVGELTFAGAEPTVVFSLPRTEEQVLFRADDVLAGEAVIGGWIRLPDGEQRGLVVRGSDRTAARVVIDMNGARVDGALAARLTPAPFTPRTLAAPTRSRASRFDLYALGDSYGAGEGAPEVPGDYDDAGDLVDGGEREVWNASLDATGEREARACHRSGVSGVELAADLLRADYPGALDVRLESYACSGATTEHLVDCPYRGAIGDHFDADMLQPPQIARLAERSRSSGVDAVYMSVGGNDMRFGFLLSECINPTGDCGGGSPIATQFFDAVARMPERYAGVERALEAVQRGLPVFISQYPNPLIDEAGEPCGDIDMHVSFGPLGVGVVEAPKVEFLSNEIHSALNRTVRAGAIAQGWTIIEDHVATFVGHGYCTSDPWFHDNTSSMRTQGHHMSDSLNDGDFPRDACIFPMETPEEPGGTAGVSIGGSIVHPTHDGYARGYAPAIAESLRSRVEDALRPLRVENLRIQGQRLNGSVTLAWDDRASTETEYQVSVFYEEGVGLPPRDDLEAPADARTIEIPLSVRARGTAQVRACYVSPAGREVCGEPRTIAWTNFPPAMPPSDVRLDTTRRAPIPRDQLMEIPQNQLVRILWSRRPEPAVVYYDVELTDADGGVRRLATADLSFVATAELASARVRSCNFAGCSPPSRAVAGPGCADGQLLSPSGRCIAGLLAPSFGPRDLACPGLERDPAGVCR